MALKSMLCHHDVSFRGFLIVLNQSLHEHELPAKAIKCVSNLRSCREGECFWGGNVRRATGAEQRSVVKQRVIDGILMAEDGSISNISRF